MAEKQAPAHGYIQGKGDLDTRVLHVLVALISRPVAAAQSQSLDPVWTSDREYLVAVRTDGASAGLWEFPGGKVEADESLYDALCREIHEEVAVTISAAEPFLTIDTPSSKRDKKVIIRLHVWNVTQWSGEPYGAEGQPVKWSRLTWNDRQHFLAPNRHMFTALRLGEVLSILNVDQLDVRELSQKIQAWNRISPDLSSSITLRLRANGLQASEYYGLLQQLFVHQFIEQQQIQVKILIDMLPWENMAELIPLLSHTAIAGVYFPSWWQTQNYDAVRLTALEMLEKHHSRLLKGVSCHSADELHWACKSDHGLKADFYSLSPVKMPNSHATAAQPLGWAQWQSLNQGLEHPGYALGGLSLADMFELKTRGGFGLAGISGLQSMPELQRQWHEARQQLETQQTAE